MAQLKNLLVNGPSKFIGPIMGKLVGGATFTQPVNFVDDNALPSKNLEFILGIDSFANGGQIGWQNLSQVTVGNASNASQVPWSGVTNKPATFPPETHNHDTLYLKRAGDTLSSPLTVTGGNAANKGKIILDQANQGQITDTGTATLFGFTSSNTLTIGSATYNTNIRGLSVSINGNAVALKSDIPTIPNISASGSGPLTLSATGHTLTGSISVGTTSAVGVVKQHTSSDCTSYTSDEGATTPAAVKKAVQLFGDQWYAPKHDHPYVPTSGDATIGPTKTFGAPNNVNQTEQVTTYFNTSNGGRIAIGKEGANSGTMLRFEQTSGTTRLKFRASATAGAMVWEQPEKNAALYFDFGDSDGNIKRISMPQSKAGTVALLSDKVAAAGTADSATTAGSATTANSANYATSAGSADSAQKDGSGNVITSKYVTVDTTQTISGAKTFSNAVTTIQNKLQLNRSGGVAQGRISFYSPSYNTWFEYMTDTAAGGCPTGAAASTYGDVTSWARRSLIENISGYGWVWEACANGATTTPLPIMSLSSSTGKLAVSGAIVGASSASFSGLITQGIPASHSTINNMNKFQSDLFVEGNGSAPNNPVKPGFYLGKSTSDENRHMDIVSGADYSYIDFNKASREEDYAVRLIANVSNGFTQFSWGSTSAITDKRLQIAGALDVTNGITGTLTGRITHPGISSSWWNGRINALVTQTGINGYSPIMSMKTTNGSWEIGHYNSGGYYNDFLINYKDDSTYNSSNNSVVHAVKIKKEGNIVLSGTDIALNSGSGTMRYNTTTKSIDFIFA